MALRLAGERALVIQGTDKQGWVREVTVQDSLPGLKINQQGTGRILDVQDGGVSKMYLPDGGNVSLVGSLVFDLANDVTITPANPGAPRILTISDPGSNDTFVFLAATQTLTGKTLTAPAINTPTGIVKGDVGLGNVDNTSDATKDAAAATLTNKTLTAPAISQVVFPATQVPSADANTLDDYEEGTWTPGLTFGGASVGMTFGGQAGFYTKVGNRVMVTGRVSLSAKGSSVGIARITGLPFTVKNDQGARAPCSFRIFTVTYTGYVMALAESNGTVIPLDYITEAGVNSNLTEANFADDSSLIVQTAYEVA